MDKILKQLIFGTQSKGYLLNFISFKNMFENLLQKNCLCLREILYIFIKKSSKHKHILYYNTQKSQNIIL